MHLMINLVIIVKYTNSIHIGIAIGYQCYYSTYCIYWVEWILLLPYY